MSMPKPNELLGNICAVECEDCQIDAGSVRLMALGVKGLVVKCGNDSVTVTKKSWLTRHGKELARD